MEKPLNIILLDDHRLFLKGLVLLLEDILSDYKVHTFDSVKNLRSNKELLKHSDLLISDIELPGEDVFELFEQIRNKETRLPILVVSMHKKLAVIKKCKSLNIQGYILKNEDDLFPEAVLKILSGRTYYSPKIESFYKKAESNFDIISTREDEIIKLIAKGLLNQEIAEKLHISPETVKTHKKNIKLKLGVTSTQEIINFAKSNYLM